MPLMEEIRERLDAQKQEDEVNDMLSQLRKAQAA
jgi:hypothetical protein